MPDRNLCPAHEEFRGAVLSAVSGIKEVLQTELRLLRDDLSRRMDESKTDRSHLHDRVTDLHGAIERISGRLNGHHHRDGEQDERPHRREEDTLAGKLKENWALLLWTAIAAIAGERVINFVGKLLGF